MNPPTILLHEDELDRCVAAYEAAWTINSTTDLARFLPERTSPHFPQILAELIRIDLEFRSSHAQSLPLESYRVHAPKLFDDPEWVRDLAFEEYRQRLSRGESVRADQYAAKYGIDVSDWPAADERPATVFPANGETVGSFRILRELGRGSFGRVYLAEQSDLAGRLVALKFSTRFSQTEPETLARLQHTHIVPIYSTHRFGRSQVFVMPYLGSTTLADVLVALRLHASLPHSGETLADNITDRASRTKLANEPQRGEPAPRTSPSLPLEQLRKLSYPEAILWIGWKLAEALAHAHDRGILHRDIKPANVLLTDEGQPMLLDFNLARDAGNVGSDIGGTPAYMAPEQLAAMKTGHTTVDGRADIYSLGLVLAELMVGHSPFTRDDPRLREHNSNISASTEAILKKCLAQDPTARYATARELADELHRQLSDQPLVATKEPSHRERLRKWRRRHPLLASAGSVTAAATLLVLGLIFAVVARQRHVERLTGERAALQHYGEFQRAVPNVIEQVAFHDHTTARVNLDQLLSRYRILEATNWIEQDAVTRLPEAERRDLLDQVGELLLLKARYEQDHLVAFQLNEQAATTYHRLGEIPRIVWQDRHELAKKLGRENEAQKSHDQARQTAPRGQDWYLSGLAARDAEEFEEAAVLFEKAVAADPKHYWSWLLLGDARTTLGRDSRAEGCFHACIALKPDLFMAYYNRGLCHHRRKQFEAAVEDFTKTIALGGDETKTLLARGLAYQGWQKWSEAEADFTAAIKLNPKRTRLYFLRAEVRTQRGNAIGAVADRADGLRLTPADELSWVTRGLVKAAAGDTPGAIADYDEALKLNPRSYSALMNKANLLDEKLHREADAIRVLGEIVRHHPQALAARSGRAVLLARQGQRSAAMDDVEFCLARHPDAATRYQLAGVYALTSKAKPEDAATAFSLLRSALKDGYGYQFLAIDADLAPIRERPEFLKLSEAVRTLESSK